MKKNAKVYKIDTEQRYMSTYDFVGHNNLSALAKLIFGKGWVAEDDINQVQEICDTIEKGRYLVRCLNIPRIDEDIEILEICGHETIKELKDLVSLFQHRKLFTNDSIVMSGDLEKLKKLVDKL